MSRVRLVGASGLIALGLIQFAQAQVYAFNDFDPGGGPSGGTYCISDAYYLCGSAASVPETIGYQFTALASGTLSEIDAAILYDGSSTNSVDIAFYADSGGNTLGALEASWATSMPEWDPAVQNLIGIISSGPVTTVFNTNPTVTLTAGQNYWIYASFQAGADTNARFYFSVGGDGEGMGVAGAQQFGVFTDDQNPNLTYGESIQCAFDVIVNPAPEPMSLVGLSVGALCVLNRLRAKVKG